jgi:hypothetical protein
MHIYLRLNELLKLGKMKLFKELLDSDSKVSSKRFAGLILLAVFAITTIVASAGVDINSNATELCKTEGILGAALLGVNVFSQLGKKKIDEDK